VAISRRLLNEGEHVVASTRTHVKALLLPAIWLILVSALAGYVSTLTGSSSAKPLLIAVVWLVALAVVLWLVGKPFLDWLTTTYTLTNRRLITRTGIFSRRGHDIPVPRISDVAYEHGIIDRILGCGTLVISDASEQGRVRLPDIPHVERVHLLISDLLTSHTDGRTDGGHTDSGHREHDRDRWERRIDDGT
jgi:uncharacterized membrane protein YdbT with pleckstrin-like domain